MRKERTRDVNQMAHAMMQSIASGDRLPTTADGKDPLAVALGRRGGLKGGPARAAAMTAKARSDSAKKAAQARWSKDN